MTAASRLLVLAVVGLLACCRSTEPFPASGRAILARLCALSPLLGIFGWYIADTMGSSLPPDLLWFVLTFVPEVPSEAIWLIGAIVSGVSPAGAADESQTRHSLAGVVLNLLVLLFAALVSSLVRH